jgi:type IX secretion system PorP/SprF family membrane protein
MVFKMRFILLTLLLYILKGISIDVYAQLNPIGALYFQNQYLGNPAMAGRKGFDVYMGYRKELSSIPGGPSSQILTGEYAFTRNAGIGLNVSNETSGLFKSLRSVASYAYHMPLNENNTKLSFGFSLGFLNERLSLEDLNGDPNDIIVG